MRKALMMGVRVVAGGGEGGLTEVILGGVAYGRD